jgi:phospholipid/cholesterol/gamma-HCH transport system substrate-binding protein
MQVEHAHARRFPGIRRRISLFLFTALIGLVGAVLLVAYKQGAFVRQTSIFFYADDVIGINKGMTVRLFGLPVGSVKHLEITSRGVQVELSIVSEYVPRLTKGTNARLTREGYIGAASLLLVPGGDAKEARAPLAEGDIIGYLPNRGVAELVDDIKNQLSPVVAELRRMIAELNRPEGDFRKSLQGASVVLQQLPETNRELRQLLRDADRAVGAVGGRADAALGATERVATRLERELPELSRGLGATLQAVAEAAAEIRSTTRKNGEALHQVLLQAPAVVRDGTQLVRDGQDVVGAAKNSWLIRDYVEPAAMRTLPLDSFEAQR